MQNSLQVLLRRVEWRQSAGVPVGNLSANISKLRNQRRVRQSTRLASTSCTNVWPSNIAQAAVIRPDMSLVAATMSGTTCSRDTK